MIGRDDSPLTAVEDRSGFTIRFHYNERGQLREIVDASARRWDLSYDAETGRAVSISGLHPNTDDGRVVYVRYDSDERGDLVQVRDALGNAQRCRYDRHLLVQETDRKGLSFRFEYDGRSPSARCVHTWGDDGIYDHKLRTKINGRRDRVRVVVDADSGNRVITAFPVRSG